MTKILILASVVALGAFAALSIPEPGAAVTSITDGDTFRIGAERIRLWGIDAPERATPHGPAATQALRDIVRDHPVSCQRQDTDRYKRTVAICYVNGKDIGGLLVARGWAWDYRRYSGGYYAHHEAAAMAERLGIWRAAQ